MSDVVTRESRSSASGRKSVLRQLVVFEAKLALDGLKDFVLAPLAIIAALWDLALDGRRGQRRLVAVFHLGASFDRWLNLYDREVVDTEDRSTFGAAGSDLLIDQIEGLARGAHDSIATSAAEKGLGRRRRNRGPEEDA